MPFIRVDSDEFEDVQYNTEFQYEEAGANFDPADLPPAERFTLKALLTMGATDLRVKYDGGHDEGFSHPQFVMFGDSLWTAEDVSTELAKSPLVGQLREAPRERGQSYYKDQTNEQVARSALDALADVIASVLLGEGFGTGEYELYGAFTANLSTGEIADDPHAQKSEPD